MKITNTQNGKKYIGKKLARFRRVRKPLKGRINKRRFTIESDWKDYLVPVMLYWKTLKKLAKTNSQEKYFSTVKAEQNVIMWKHESNLPVKC